MCGHLNGLPNARSFLAVVAWQVGTKTKRNVSTSFDREGEAGIRGWRKSLIRKRNKRGGRTESGGK